MLITGILFPYSAKCSRCSRLIPQLVCGGVHRRTATASVSGQQIPDPRAASIPIYPEPRGSRAEGGYPGEAAVACNPATTHPVEPQPRDRPAGAWYRPRRHHCSSAGGAVPSYSAQVPGPQCTSLAVEPQQSAHLARLPPALDPAAHAHPPNDRQPHPPTSMTQKNIDKLVLCMI